jgi:hypothetical protein
LGFIFASDDVDTSLLYNKIDVLSPIEGTYQNNNLFYFPESYEGLIHLANQGARYLAP